MDGEKLPRLVLDGRSFWRYYFHTYIRFQNDEPIKHTQTHEICKQ